MDVDPQLLTWEVEPGPERAHLVLHGELDIAAVDHLRVACAAAAACAQPVTIDLGDVTFLDGGGLRVLMELAECLAARGIEVLYGSTARPVDRYLDLRGTTLQPYEAAR